MNKMNKIQRALESLEKTIGLDDPYSRAAAAMHARPNAQDYVALGCHICCWTGMMKTLNLLQIFRCKGKALAQLARLTRTCLT